MRSSVLRSIAVFIASIALSTPASAHHGSGTFDLTKTVSFPEARLTKLEFYNPHGWLYFETTEADGRVMKHRCEMRSAHVLRRSGWTPDLFHVGERIQVTASPDRADPASCYLQTIVFANGSRMDRYGQYVKAPDGEIKEVRGELRQAKVNRPLRRPTGEPNISGEWAPEQVVMVNPRGTGGGLVPLSQIRQYDTGERRGGGGGARGGGGPPPGPRTYGGTELTELGTKEAAAFGQQDNPRFRCETTSILFDWTFDGPVNRITQNKDTIVIEYGQLNLKRTVFMNMKEHPAGVKPSRAGHSIGRWDGDTLVVDTVGFLPGVLNAPVRHSDKLHVVERFSLDSTGTTLTRNYQADDPAYLKGKYSGEDKVQPADASYTQDKCKEQGFTDYSKQVQKK
jgi:Family of unknown function (DUF6152)